MSLSKTCLAAWLACAIGGAHAHQLWLERDGAQGPVRLYMGDADGERDQGEAIAKIQASTKVFHTKPEQALALEVKPDHLLAPSAPRGDLRLLNEAVWAPWKGEDGEWTAAIFNGKVGRQETRAVQAFEFVPLKAGGDVFVLTFQGKPLANHALAVVDPGQWRKNLRTDAQGQVRVPVRGKGRYLLLSQHKVAQAREVAGQAVTQLDYVGTVSFTAP